MKSIIHIDRGEHNSTIIFHADGPPLSKYMKDYGQISLGTLPPEVYRYEKFLRGTLFAMSVIDMYTND